MCCFLCGECCCGGCGQVGGDYVVGGCVGLGEGLVGGDSALWEMFGDFGIGCYGNITKVYEDAQIIDINDAGWSCV